MSQENTAVCEERRSEVKALSATSPRLARFLENATGETLERMTRSESGESIGWRELDVDMSARHLVEVIVGTFGMRQA